MIAGGGLGEFAPEEIGPVSEQAANGVLDVVVDDEASAVAVVRRLLGYLRGPSPAGACDDQALLRTLLPENDREGFDVRPVVESLADHDSVTWLRAGWAPELVTAFARIDGMPVGVLANQSTDLAGALTSDASARMLLMDFWAIRLSFSIQVVYTNQC